MILDHAPNAVEILKFGGLNYAEFKNFVYTVEDLFFSLSSIRANKYASYTKDELNIDVQDEYCADIDRGQCLSLATPSADCLCYVRPLCDFKSTVIQKTEDQAEFSAGLTIVYARSVEITIVWYE